MEEQEWQDFKNSVKKIVKKSKIPDTYKAPEVLKVIHKKALSLDEYGIFFEKTTFYTKKQEKKLRKTSVEKTIDLHGKTVEEAFLALKNFIINSRNENIKCVIAICGKGINQNLEFTGKIKLNIEHWLEGFIKSGLVSHYITAEKKRGGEGAYRIYLKNKFIV